MVGMSHEVIMRATITGTDGLFNANLIVTVSSQTTKNNKCINAFTFQF